MFEIYLIIFFAITAVLSQDGQIDAPSSVPIPKSIEWSAAVLKEGISCSEMAQALPPLLKLSRKSMFIVTLVASPVLHIAAIRNPA